MGYIIFAWILGTSTAEIGIKENYGKLENQRIIEYHSATVEKNTSDEIPWCSSFACWVIEELKMVSPRSAVARSWLEWGYELKEPVPGCIVVLASGNSSWQAHVGFFVKDNDDFIWVLGGNQKDKVSVEKFSKKKLLAYRSPINIEG